MPATKGEKTIDWHTYHPHSRLIVLLLEQMFPDLTWRQKTLIFNAALEAQLTAMGFPDGIPGDYSDQIASQFRMSRIKPHFWHDIFEYMCDDEEKRRLVEFLLDGLTAIAAQAGLSGPAEAGGSTSEDAQKAAQKVVDFKAKMVTTVFPERDIEKDGV